MTSREVRRRQRMALVVLIALVVLLAFLLIRCVALDAEPERPHPTELGYPPAPAQFLPDPAEEHAGAAEVTPVAELADPEWVAAAADETGIPERAVQAYAGAALRMGELKSDCGLGWNTLAGIGEVESRHGSYGGAQIADDGTVDPPVIGVPLDGSEGVMEIPDTDGGELDGDDEWDRALGPMQFIPTTWEEYGRDGNLDGEADVHNYDDAAWSAAVYLCDHGDDLAEDFGWNDAVAAYNRSVDYANDVASYAQQHGEAL